MIKNSGNNLSDRIKGKAYELGFNLCGIAKLRSLDEHGPWLKSWTDSGMNDIMGYLAKDIEKRIDPRNLLPEAESLIVTGLSYNSEIMQKDPEAPVISRYTYGDDYHRVIKGKLLNLLSWIKEIDPGAEGIATVDSSNVLEKAWAVESGIGWRGRHSVIINKEIGSFFFIGILILTVELQSDKPCNSDFCGSCRECIDNCPTGAINDNRTIDARKCIANLTIERRGPVPETLVPYLGRRIYGCDRCQEVCPWNKKAKTGLTPEFRINKEIAEMTKDEWVNLPEERFNTLFKKTAMERVKYEKLMGNIASALKENP